jgi:hypothetical protein
MMNLQELGQNASDGGLLRWFPRLAAGAGVIFLSPVLFPQLRPVAKSLIKGALAASGAAKRFYDESRDELEEMSAEAREELEASRVEVQEEVEEEVHAEAHEEAPAASTESVKVESDMISEGEITVRELAEEHDIYIKDIVAAAEAAGVEDITKGDNTVTPAERTMIENALSDVVEDISDQ